METPGMCLCTCSCMYTKVDHTLLDMFKAIPVHWHFTQANLLLPSSCSYGTNILEPFQGASAPHTSEQLCVGHKTTLTQTPLHTDSCCSC